MLCILLMYNNMKGVGLVLMIYYDSSDVSKLLQRALKGDKDARIEISSIKVPFAVSKDYSILIIAQDKHAFIDSKGEVHVLNSEPKADGLKKQMADVYQRDSECISWFNFQLPEKFIVTEMKFEDDKFSFISSENQVVSGDINQINRAMMKLAFTTKPLTETEIEKCFFNIPDLAITQTNQKKTTKQNYKITDEIIGLVRFNEQLQGYYGEYKTASLSFKVFIDTDSRKKTIQVLSFVHKVISDFKTFDESARNFAAEELLALKNDAWLDEGEAIVSKEDFISKMLIESITFEENKQFQICYNDGELFWGHSIIVDINKKGMPNKAEIYG